MYTFLASYIPVVVVYPLLANGESPIFPLEVYQPAYLSSSAVTPAGYVHISNGNNVVRMWVQLEMMCVVWVGVTKGE